MIQEFFPLNFLATNCSSKQIGLRIEKLCGKNGNEKTKISTFTTTSLWY